jgi:hypothetical protein
MIKRYLHIGFIWKSGSKADTIAPLIENNVDDWFKYGGNCWLVYTKYDQSQWTEFLSKHIAPNDSFAIYEVTNLPKSNGRLAPKLWEWFNKPRF